MRALRILREVDVIAAEDTRHSAVLLDHHGIGGERVALHEHNEQTAGERLVARMQGGARVALISDAGTPAVCDPGARLVRLARAAQVPVVPIPGPSSLVTALSAAGLDQPQFHFHGFLPAKGGARRETIQTLADMPWPAVFFEAPHRIEDCLADLRTVCGGARRVVLAKELTKSYETILECSLDEANAWLAADERRQKGEFVVTLLPDAAPPSTGTEADTLLRALLKEVPVSQAARIAHAVSGLPRKALYERALALRGDDEDIGEE